MMASHNAQSQDLLEMARPSILRFSRYMQTLPTFSLVLTTVMVFFQLLSLVTNIFEAFVLCPSSISNFELSRLTTYPLIHSSIIQFCFCVAAFIPLLARFERQYGTLRTLAMILGPFESVPGLLYAFLNGLILRQDSAIYGSYGFAFVLLTIEVMIYAKGELSVVVAGTSIPTFAGPLILAVPTWLLVPGTSATLLAGSILVGYIFSSGRVDFLLLPLKIVNFIEEKAEFIVRLVPGYVTARAAEMSNAAGLPTTETRSDYSPVTMTNTHEAETGQQPQQQQLGSLTVPGGPGSGRPGYNRQVSSAKFMPSGQRED